MIHSTANGAFSFSIWGDDCERDLMDRDPLQVQKLVKEQGARRLVAIGDALHSMSPFKGQGANQALKDGPLLGHWLQAASIDSAVTSFWREIVQRTAPVVSASREAAQELHSPAIMTHGHGFAGVKAEERENFLNVLRDEKIGAELGANLDKEVEEIIRSLDLFDVKPESTVCEKQQKKALHFAATGNMQALRQLTLDKHSVSIRSARDQDQRSCLHLASKGGHAHVCRWLLTEVECDIECIDQSGKVPMEYAENESPTLAIFHCFSEGSH